MQATGHRSLRQYLRHLEWWHQTLGRDVTPGQRVYTILQGLEGGAAALFEHIPVNELVNGTNYGGQYMTP
jgi:hypothetical protein